MFGIPFLTPAILVRGAIALAFAIFLGYMVHLYNDHIRAPLEQKYKDRETELVARATGITNMMTDLRLKEQSRHAEENSQAIKRFTEVSAKLANVQNTLSGITLPADVVGVFTDAARAANARRGTNSGGKEGAEAVPALPETPLIYNERDLASFVTVAADAYDDAYGLWKACRTREDILLAGIAKGAAK